MSRAVSRNSGTGNVEGTWVVYNLWTKTTAKRNTLTIVPIPDIVIAHMNKLAERRAINRDPQFGVGRGNHVLQPDEPMPPEAEQQYQPPDDHTFPIPDDPATVFEPAEGEVQPVGDIIFENADDALHDDEQTDPGILPTEDGVAEDNVTIPDDEAAPDIDDLPEIEFTVPEEDIPEPASILGTASSGPDADAVSGRYNLRGSRKKPGHYAQKRAFGLHITVNQALNKMGKPAVRSIVKEILQMHSKGVWSGVRMKDLSFKQRKSIISSSMFLKEKYRADGTFEKLKARLVAGGHQQDRTLFEDGGSTSPTISTSSVFILAAIAATENRAVATIDVPGAYLNADMPESEEVLMRLDPYITRVLTKIAPEYEEFRDEKGRAVVKLKKALYGCIQSAKLWYEELTGQLMKIGFSKNRMDECVLNRVERDGTQTTVGIHVDDMFVSNAHEYNIDQLVMQLNDVYDGLSVCRGRKLNYLGMHMDFTRSKHARIDMNTYIDELLTFTETTGVAKTPASSCLFTVNDDAEPLNEEEKAWFHTTVAKAYYLGKRVRPETLAALAFLVTRVSSPTQQDKAKLIRLLQYLNGTRKLGLTLGGDQDITIMASVDASYGVHGDFKSHTGCVIGVGRGVIYAKSGKQRINTKSSTEAELVGLSDMIGQITWTRNLLTEQGYKLPPTPVGQDNLSTIALIKNGKSNSERTRHIGIRFFFVKDRVDSGDIQVKYVPTEEMVADILTKPLQGALFLKLRKMLLNEE